MNQWVHLVVLACVVTSCVAATAGRQPAKPAGVIGEQGKDKPGQRVSHAAFASAGNKPGVELWRIEKFEPVVVQKNDIGKFYTGDSYIVLSTKELGGKKAWDIFFWLGSETSQDESGAAAIYTVQLDDKLGGAAIQHREVQGYESPAFKTLFNNNIKYAAGGVASGLRHVDNKVEKKMYVVKGKKNIRVKPVEPSAASLNRGDSFIYDAGTEIYVYQGPKSSRLEKLKSVSAANVVRDVDRNGRAKITVIDDFNNADDIARFLSILGAEKLKQIPDETVGGDDAQFEKHEESLVSLHKVSDASGSIKVEKINQKPLKQQMLDTNDCFILDTEQSDIYVWQGKKATPKEKSEAIKKAEDIKKAKKYPAWTKIVKVIEHGEPSVFRQIFQTWQGVGETRPRLIRDTSNFAVCEPGKAKLYHLKAFDSKLFVKFISQFDQHNLKSDDVMIVDDGCKIFVWFGKDSSDYERMQGLRPSKFLPRFMQNRKPQYLETLYFKQHSEPYEFTKMFPSWTPDLWDENEYEENEIPQDK